MKKTISLISRLDVPAAQLDTKRCLLRTQNREKGNSDQQMHKVHHHFV
ncbi:hypothetical protein MUE07_005043 [Vibrio parahaemolyticus]|nr:hypothetical protein [Vibrio parahaemolyticus]EJB1765990.1 hypothetical protein [Vibrio parahaemolyticus]